MKVLTLTAALIVSGLLVAPAPARACGEGQFNVGQGLRYQGYLAPHPATVLVYADPASGADSADRQAVYHGLEQAGHRVTVVTDSDALSRALASKHYDVVIANFNDVAAVESSVGNTPEKPLMLPVVARSERNSPALSSKFALFLIDGASLGQYLKVINQAVAGLK